MGSVVQMPKFDAEDLIKKIQEEVTPNSKLLIIHEDEDKTVSIAAIKFTADELLWNIESFKLSLLSGQVE